MLEVVREIAVAATWRPLSFFGYDDLVDPDLLARSYLDNNRLVERHPQLSADMLEEAQAWAQRLRSRLAEE